MQPAVITFRPDNLLTVGLLGAIAYLSAVLLVQLGMRLGIVAGAPATPANKAAAVAPAAGTVAA